MAYRYPGGGVDHSDLASGSVLRSAPGHPAFPVRLGRELFLRAAAHLPGRAPLGLWDPCCGSGYLATVVGMLHRERLRYVLCSDAAAEAAALAGRNLALLTGAGLAERARDLRRRAAEHGKPGYEAAAEAADRLAGRLRETGGDLPGYTRVADVFEPDGLATALAAAAPVPPDVVLTDVPYGVQTSWLGAVPADGEPLPALVRSLCDVLPDHAVIVLCSRARKLSLGTGVPTLERLRSGRRAAFLGRVADLRGAV